MENLLHEFLDCMVCYFDDVALFSDSCDHHIDLINNICTIAEQARYKVNPNKCDWAKQEMEFLGYLITPDGLKPLRSKINAILAVKKPRNLKQLQSFLGLVTFYHDMWPQRSHVLIPSQTCFLQPNMSGLMNKTLDSYVWNLWSLKIPYWYFLTQTDNFLLRQIQAITNLAL